MGEFKNGEWVPDGAGPRRDRHAAAKRAMKLAHHSDRPIEAAVGNTHGDDYLKAARQLFALTHSVDPDDISPKDIAAVLEHGRQAAGHDDDPATASAHNARAIGELAEDTDDAYEDISARSHEDEDDEEDYEDSDVARFDWLESTYGLTPEQLAEALQGLDPDDAQAAVDGFEELYGLHLKGYGPEAAEELYLAQFDSDEDADAESYAGADDGFE